MLILAKLFANLISALNSEVSPRQVAAGFAFGVTIGLVPVRGLLPYFLTLVSLLININLAAVALSAGLFKIISFFLDPLANKIGFYFLTLPSLKSIYTQFYNMPLLPYTRFNNTIVFGSVVLGLLCFVPVYLISKAGIVKYRANLKDKFLKLKIVQILKASSLWRFYESYRNATGK